MLIVIRHAILYAILRETKFVWEKNRVFSFFQLNSHRNNNQEAEVNRAPTHSFVEHNQHELYYF